MFKKILHNKFLKKEIVLLFILYLTLLISFQIGENSTGGAILDYFSQKKISEQFSVNFIYTLLNYDGFSSRHSPILIIFLSFFEKFNIPDFLIRIIHLHICLLLPFVFYKCLEVKFTDIDKNIFLLFTSLIFLSPTFRSLSIWPDSRLIGLLIFTIAIFFYLKFLEQKKFHYALKNVLFVALSAYISPNFSIFSIFFFFSFIQFYGIKSKNIFYIFLINIFLALPAIYYVFYLDINFLIKSAAIGLKDSDKIIFNNIFNDLLITFTIFFFYIFPFLITKIIKLNNVLKFKNIFFTLFIFILCFYYFDYNASYSGGGIFFKFSHYFFKNSYFFYLISIISILICLPLIISNQYNLFLFILILINNPQYTIYHKYFDPFLLISFFTIFYYNFDIKKIKTPNNYIFVFFYFFLFLVLSNLKYLWKI